MSNPIPIRNIYYLLCYAWNRLDEGNMVDVTGIDSTELADLFAGVLIKGTQHLLRRGLEQGYEKRSEELTSIRGRVDIAKSVRRMLITHGYAACDFDELTVNTPANQILKATIWHLSKIDTLEKQLHKQLLFLYRELRDIEDIALRGVQIKRIQLHRNNRFYRFLLNVCEMVQGALLVDESSGKYKFKDFIRDEKRMAWLFESFLLNFYKLECPQLKVRKEQISWDAESDLDQDLRYLPTMETDISIRDSQRTLIIDAKYYKETMQSYYDTAKVHSGNLYQLLAYLKNLEARKGPDAIADGMLLYPVVDKPQRLNYVISGHNICICTVDLSQEWQVIRQELLSLVA